MALSHRQRCGHRPRRLAAVALLTAGAAVTVTLGNQQPAAAATGWEWEQSSLLTVATSPDGSIVGNANVSSFTVPGSSARSVLYSWSKNEDVGTAAPNTGYLRSTDGGQTFPGTPQQSDTSFYATTRLKSGDLIDVAFIPSAKLNATTVSLRVKRSSDDGATWTPVTSTLSLNSGWQFGGISNGLRINPNILVDPDDNLYLTYYTVLSGETGERVEMAKSSDEGATWQRLAPIKQPSSTEQYNETGITWANPTSAGATPEMVTVITEDDIDSPGWRHTSKLITARSSDLGKTWHGQRALPISFDPGYSLRPGPDGMTRFGVSPDIELLPDGIMGLRWGRPDNWFAISEDNGNSFEHARRTYVNWPSDGFVWHGSSGNGTIAVTGTSTLIASGDNCAPTWGCPSTDSGWTTNGDYYVWRRIITLIPPS